MPTHVNDPIEVERAAESLQRGRESYGRRAWIAAHTLLTEADLADPLEAEELELLATSAYMIGRDEEYLRIVERAYRGYAGRGATCPAMRCAVWLCIHLGLRGEAARSRGWLGRARRLANRVDGDCVERGYLSLVAVEDHRAAGDDVAACTAAAEAAAVGERFDDADLVALAQMDHGRALCRLAQLAEGLPLLDEAMVAATTGELSPIVTGLVFCSVIDGCQEAYEFGRAREWTTALSEWWDEQPEMVAFTGRCLLHRSEILQLRGAWDDALVEARRARERFVQGYNQQAAEGGAAYREGEIHRLRGAFDEAEEAYRAASRCGREPQPGLALLRLAQGKVDAAAAAIRRATGETTEWQERAALLPAYVEIMLATGDVEEARRACADLQDLPGLDEDGAMCALHAQARGAVELVSGDARSALCLLRHAWHIWQRLEAPYETARVRVLVGRSCRALGDDDTAALEIDAARAAFAALGAAPDLARLEPLVAVAPAGKPHGLTLRELQVLRLIAAGRSNKAIAAELVLSGKTVERHVSNILSKLRIPSRAAAAAFAYEHELVARS